MGIDESAAPDDVLPTDTQKEDDENKPVAKEQEETENALYRLFKLQRSCAIDSLNRLTCDGNIMSILCDPDTQGAKLYDTVSANKAMRRTLQPILRRLLMERGTKLFEGSGVFDIEHEFVNSLMRQLMFKIEDTVEQNAVLLRATLDDADRFKWTGRQVEKRIKSVFSFQRAHEITQTMLTDYLDNVAVVLDHMKSQNTNILDTTVLTR